MASDRTPHVITEAPSTVDGLAVLAAVRMDIGEYVCVLSDRLNDSMYEIVTVRADGFGRYTTQYRPNKVAGVLPAIAVAAEMAF